MRFTTAFLLISAFTALPAWAIDLPYNFDDGYGVQLTATTTSSSVTFTDPQSVAAPDVLIYNEGTNSIYYANGKGSATAILPGSTPAPGATPIGAGMMAIFRKNPGNDTIAVITATSTSKVDIVAGTGQ